LHDVAHFKILESDRADVVPLQFSGTVDTDLTKLTANEMMVWGLANLWNQGQEGGYRVCPGGHPVNDFGRPPAGSAAIVDSGSESQRDVSNFFEKAFPGLFPYGRGGVEGDQVTPIPFREHVQWALQYFDHRFRRHETFPFVAFGICSVARLLDLLVCKCVGKILSMRLVSWQRSP
jgi:hypothetical protein